MELDRKQFLTGAAATAATAALAGATSLASADEAPAQPWMPEAWDYECDVVVVGTGSILSAALRAHDAGLKVIILEKHPTFFGGTTALSGGGMNCPNTSMALAAGCEVDREDIKSYYMGVAEGQVSEEIIDMILDNGPAAVDYMNNECGYKWVHFGHVPHMSYNFYYPAPDMEEKYDDVPWWVTAGTHEATGATTGRALAEFGKDAVAARGIEVMMGTAATKLIYAGNPALGDGEVIGLWAEKDGQKIAIKARYAVVLGTGGFDCNQEMVKHYINHPIHTTCALPTNTGDGHIMAMELGANMRNMNEVFNHTFNMMGHPERYISCDMSLDTGVINSEQANPIWITPGKIGSVIVNRHGERFVCEGCSYDLLGRAFDAYDCRNREFRNIPAYVIVDSTYTDCFGNATPMLPDMIAAGEFPEWVHKFDSLEELAEGMGIDAEKLVATIERYNGFCETGVDLDFGRGEYGWDKFTTGDMARFEAGELKNPSLAPVAVPPFFCVELSPGMLQTSGGMEINTNAQVMNVRGEVIPRLYAGSNCIASCFGRGYPNGGTSLANGFIVGYVAANHIATLEPWE